MQHKTLNVKYNPCVKSKMTYWEVYCIIVLYYYCIK